MNASNAQSLFKQQQWQGQSPPLHTMTCSHLCLISVLINKVMQRSGGDHRRSASFRSLPDALSLKTNALLQQRLKKEISMKFQHKRRSDEINKTANTSHKRHSSSLIHNPLTKPSFSLNDSITHKASLSEALLPAHPLPQHPNSSRVNRSYRQRYNSFDEGLFKTSTRQSRPHPVPSVSLKKSPPQSQPVPQSTPLSSRQNKFKLLIKEQRSNYRSASQRKISRIDEKIKQLKYRRNFLESLIPKEVPKPVPPKRIPKTYDITDDEFREKILKMLRLLIRTMELYFNMYGKDHLVGGHFKRTESFNPKIAQIFMKDEERARRFTRPEQLTPLFAVFGPARQRSPFYMEEDMYLFNVMNNFLLKLEKKHTNQAQTHNKLDLQGRQVAHSEMEVAKKSYENQFGKHEGINGINKFVENRLRFDPLKRESYMSELEKRGVVLNLIERSRELVLRDRETAMNQALLSGRPY